MRPLSRFFSFSMASDSQISARTSLTCFLETNGLLEPSGATTNHTRTHANAHPLSEQLEGDQIRSALLHVRCTSRLESGQCG